MGDGRRDWLDDALRPLKTAARAHAWPSAEHVQLRGARRRQRRIAAVSGGAGVTLAIVLVVALLSSSSGDHTRGPAKSAFSDGVQMIPGPDGSVQLVADAKTTGAPVNSAGMSAVSLAEQNFALQLTREELSQDSSRNVLLAPMSADIDLAMLELGSGGATAHEIATTLQSSAISSNDQAEGWSGLADQLMAAQTPGELHLANSIWVEKGLTVQSTFLRAAASTFGDDTYQVDFASSSATQAINAWVDQETAGRIKTLYSPTDLSPATELVLANALHFHAAWQRQLLGAASVEAAPFFTSAGARVSVPMIVDSEDSFLANETPAYDAVQLPYSNGRFAALLIKPTSGSISSFLPTLSPSYLSTVTASLQNVDVHLSMPELHLSALESLKEPLSAMGMARAFLTADFFPCSARPACSTRQ
jgi:serpin B